MKNIFFLTILIFSLFLSGCLDKKDGIISNDNYTSRPENSVDIENDQEDLENDNNLEGSVSEKNNDDLNQDKILVQSEMKLKAESISEKTYRFPSEVENLYGSVPPKGKSSIKIYIDPVSNLFIMIAKSDSNLSVKLMNPSGKIATSELDSDEISMFNYEGAANIEYGNWTVELSNTSSQPIDYNINVVGHSNIYVNHNEATQVNKYEPFKLKMSLGEAVGDSFQPIKNAKITAQIFKEADASKPVRTIALLDTEQADSYNLQIYQSGDILDLEPGQYLVKYLIDGNKISGIPFKRIGTVSNEFLAVSSGNARLVTIMSGKGQDINGDDIVDIIYIQFMIDVINQGKFDITGTLIDSKGNKTAASNEAGGPDGQYGANLLFELKATGMTDGNFTLVDVKLFEEVDYRIKWLDSWNEDYQTQSYKVVK